MEDGEPKALFLYVKKRFAVLLRIALQLLRRTKAAVSLTKLKERSHDAIKFPAVPGVALREAWEVL